MLKNNASLASTRQRHSEDIAKNSALASDLNLAAWRADLLEAIQHTHESQKVLADSLFVLENLLEETIEEVI